MELQMFRLLWFAGLRVFMTEAAPTGVISCAFPECPAEAYLEMPCRIVNCTATCSCKEGYWYTGTMSRTCMPNQLWSGSPGICEEVACPQIPDPENGKVLLSVRSYLGQATMQCYEGYIYTEPDFIIRRCLGNNTWSGREGICKAVFCQMIPDPQNGRILQPDRSYLASATVVCNEGYMYSKPNATAWQCKGDGEWRGESGICEAKRCPHIRETENGILSSQGGSFKDTVSLQCTAGHILDGPSTITCLANGNWSAALGQCRNLDEESKAQKGLTSTLLPILLAAVVILLTGSAIYVVWRCRDNTKRRGTQGDEEAPCLAPPHFYLSFTLEEDFAIERENDGTDDFKLFASCIEEEVS